MDEAALLRYVHIMNLFGMVTTRKSAEYTPLALRSFFAHTPFHRDDQFLLIDNDGDFNLPSEFERSALIIDRPPSPRGFAANANAAIARAREMRADLYFLNNDLIFTPGWLDPLATNSPTILSPLSNREVQFSCTVAVPKTAHIVHSFATDLIMTREQYRGNESALDAIAQANARAHQGSFPVYVLPFFCVKLPLGVMDQVGFFDESFGRAGGEDYDYALRSWLAGFRVEFVLGSYVLHFGGRSSHSGGETKTEQHEREEHFKGRFRQKWGDALFQLILEEKATAVQENSVAFEHQQRKELAAAIRSLMGDRSVPIGIH